MRRPSARPPARPRTRAPCTRPAPCLTGAAAVLRLSLRRCLSPRADSAVKGPMPGPIDHPALQPLKAKFADTKLLVNEFRGMVTVVVPRENILAIAAFLHDDPAMGYDMLAEL